VKDYVTNSHFIILLLLRVLLSVEFLHLTPTFAEAHKKRLFSHIILTPANPLLIMGQMIWTLTILGLKPATFHSLVSILLLAVLKARKEKLSK
jgi:hypothetical protein